MIWQKKFKRYLNRACSDNVRKFTAADAVTMQSA